MANDTSEEMSKLAVDNAEAAVDDDDFVDPWNVTSKSSTGVDYDKLISK